MSKSTKSRRNGRLQSQTRQLSTEKLEDRQMMTVYYHGGAVLPHVEAQNVYLGRDWNSTSGQQMAGRLEGFTNNFVHSSYMDMLTNAGYGVGRGSFHQGIIDPANINKGNYLLDSQIRNEVQSLVSHQYVAAPDANRLYVVYVEPGVAIMHDHDHNATSIKDFLGYHGEFAGHNAAGYAVDVHYAVIAYPGGYNFSAASEGFHSNFDDLTCVTSHEVAEAATDPNVNYKKLGWYDDQRGEIGDVAAGHFVSLNGYCVQMEVNKNDQLIYPAGAKAYGSSSGASSASSSNSAMSAGMLSDSAAAAIDLFFERIDHHHTGHGEHGQDGNW